MTYRATHPEDGMVYCCPDCEAAGPTDCETIWYRCRDCGAEFVDPDEREVRHGGTTNPYDDDGLPNRMPDDVKAKVLAARGEADD